MNVYIELKRNRQYLTKQEYKTLKGQANAGDIDGALKGLDKILRGNNNGKNRP